MTRSTKVLDESSPVEAPAGRREDVLRIEAAGFPPDLPASTYDLLARSAEQFGDAPALSFFLTADRHRDPARWSYRELFAEVTRAANVFHQLGIGAQDVVAYLLPNLPETHFVLWGAEAAGIAMAINPLLESEAVAKLLAVARAKVLVTIAPFPGTDLYDKAMTAAAQVSTLAHVVLFEMADQVHAARRQPALRPPSSAAPERVEVHHYRALAARATPDRRLVGRRISPGAIASYYGTGGTTGQPKLARLTHGAEVANAWMASRMVGDVFGPTATLFCGLPLFHVNATMVTGLAAFLRGGHVVLGTPKGYRESGVIERFWEIVEHHRVTVFSGVPTLYAALLQRPVGGHDVSSLRYGFCGAAPMATGLTERFEAATGITILEGYGLTEATCVCSVNPVAGPRRAGSVGLALPFQDLRTLVLDPAGRYLGDAAVGEVGTVAVAGPNVFAGYLSDAHNDGNWIDRGDGKRWLNTGDLGRIDADGFLWLTGRAKDVIIRGGHNIDPLMIEDALARHPAVALAAAVGRPDAYAGEVPVAYVQLRVGARATTDELFAFAAAHVSEQAARPKAVRIIDSMPLTAVGKIFKPTLREWEAKVVVEEALAALGINGEVVAATDERRGLVIRLTLNEATGQTVRAALAGYVFNVDLCDPGDE